MSTFEQLKQHADELKTKRDQALGVIKNIEDGWEQKYGTRDVNVLKDKVKNLESELSELDTDFKNKLSEAEKILEGK
jgi:predicted  nucleic acid-binding Zn-ribbon protein